MRKHIKGSIATYFEFSNGTPRTYIKYLTVLKRYAGEEKVPAHWPEIRLTELAASVTWAMKNMNPEAIMAQAKLEERSE